MSFEIQAACLYLRRDELRHRQGLEWQRPTHLTVGAGIATISVVVGMLVRSFAFDGGTPPSFVLVATLFLSLALIGWRVVAMRLQPTD